MRSDIVDTMLARAADLEIELALPELPRMGEVPAEDLVARSLLCYLRGRLMFSDLEAVPMIDKVLKATDQLLVKLHPPPPDEASESFR